MSAWKFPWKAWQGCLVAAAVIAAGAFGADDDAVKLFPIVKDGKWGYMDETGKVVIEPQYDGAGDFSEGLAWVGVGLPRGFIDKTGTMVIEPKYGWTGNFHSGLVAALGHGDGKPLGGRHNDIWGDDVQLYKPSIGGLFVDKTGKKWAAKDARVSPVDFSEGKICVRNKCYSADGKEMTHDAEELCPFSEGLAAAKKEDRWGYLDHEMKWAIEPRFTVADVFSQGMAAVIASDMPAPKKRKDYYGLLNSGKVKWGYIDTTGALVIECQFEEAGPFSDDLAAVRIEGKWGYVHKESKQVVIDAKHDYAWPFSEGMGRILAGEKHGFVDTNGKLVIEPKYDVAWEFSKGLARVGIGEKEGYINRKGEYVWEPTE